ncbi:MAG: adenylate/guanylate cyclase domain-containing protein [Paracoccaceae bacterium]
MSELWRGTLATRARVASGLVLFTYALLHFLNIGLGLISSDLMHQMQDARQVISRSLPGTIVLYTALLTHAGLGLARLATRRTLRLPAWEWVQTALGLLIPALLLTHIIYTRGAHEIFGVNDQMAYLIGLIWNTASGWKQAALLLIVWAHGCIGLHFWLRGQKPWRQNLPLLAGLAALVPAFALAGFLTEGRRLATLYEDPDIKAEITATFNLPDGEGFAQLWALKDASHWVFWGLLALVAASYLLARLLTRRRKLRITYVDGPTVVATKGMTLLEISRANGIPHTSLCGGRGRCTTCRVVIEDGAEHLTPPSPAEAASLAAVGATANTRLACQIRPTEPLTVFRVFRPDGRQRRAHASEGREHRMAILFLDIRGFTARTNGQLPYDVVFLLNRFFDAIVPAITRAGGTVDKYLGDGLLAIYEAPDATASARAALTSVADIGVALAAFNVALQAEGSPALRIGMGLHLGDLVLGEIGAAGHAPRTIIGETVNAASRLEAATKDLSVELLVSASVLHAAGQDTGPLTLVTLDLRGVAEPVHALAVPRAMQLPATLGRA